MYDKLVFNSVQFSTQISSLRKMALKKSSNIRTTILKVNNVVTLLNTNVTFRSFKWGAFNLLWRQEVPYEADETLQLYPPPAACQDSTGNGAIDPFSRRARGEGWHSDRTRAHCHKCLDFTPDNQKTWICRKKNESGNIWWGVKVISRLGLLTKFKSFLLHFLWHLSHFFYSKTLIARVFWQIFRSFYQKINLKKKVKILIFPKSVGKKSKINKYNHVFEILLPKNIKYHEIFLNILNI